MKVLGEKLEEALSARLVGRRDAVICGVGNDLRGEDGIGLIIAKWLEGSVPDDVSVLDCGEVPENFIGQVAAHKPTHVIIIDAARVGRPAGTIVLVEPEDIYPNTLSAHRLPLSFFASVVSRRIGGSVDVFTLGIQIERADFGDDLSEEVMTAARRLCDALVTVLSET